MAIKSANSIGKNDIKNLKETAQRILGAIKNKEKIILYGDADLDGVTSVIILQETLQNLGGGVSTVYFPDREKEGYGINEKALDYLKDLAPALFIALDCGISNFQEIEKARKLGFEIIIIDHHQVLERLPSAEIIVDPKQKNDPSFFKELATVGIVYKLTGILLGSKLSPGLKASFLEMVALATIADMMPEKEENRLFIYQGLKSLENTWRPGLKAFFEIDSIKQAGSIRNIAQKIVSALNAMTVSDHLNEAYLLLTSSSLERARVLAEDLVEKSLQKQKRIREIEEEVKTRIKNQEDLPVIFEGDSHWPLVLIGSVASKICHQFQKPVFLFKRQENESKGAVRTPSNFNGVEAMKSCRGLLKTYGGHPLAAGFTVENKNLEEFKECLIEYFKT